MAAQPPLDPERYVAAIRARGMSIYDPITVGDPELWIPTPELQSLLDSGLRGRSVAGLANRTRSKVVKQWVCEVLGYLVPASFKKSRPRFPGQEFDTYTQKNSNLQVWNDEISAFRRYVVVDISDTGTVQRVKVITGDTLSALDRTGTLTKKYQARCVPGAEVSELITPQDTQRLSPFVASGIDLGLVATPVLHPSAGQILPISRVFERLSTLVGRQFADAGADQERNRGAALHRLACEALGYRRYQDNGQFPDVRHQLLEVKLQTAETIDLGLVTPESTDPLDVPMIDGVQVRHCDVRYGIFYGTIANGMVTLTNVFVTTGAAFFTRFPQCQGKVLNAKLQIPLPADFFGT